jgi:undecaprenyl-phosphate 4-deoxy-4-formamido-L-arabinose transferase
MNLIDLSVVIPVFRSESVLEPLFERLTAVLDATERSYEIVFVDDGSPDRSWDVLCELRARSPERVTAIQLMRNFGQHNALMCGFAHARGHYIVTMDDDLQNPPEEVPKLLEAIRKGDLDVVYGQYDKKQHHQGRNLGSKVVNAFFRLVFRSRATITSFRIIRRDVLESILSYDLNFTLVDGLLAWNTRRIGTVPVEHHPRQEGGSGYSLGKLLTLALNLFTNFSLLPLQIASFVGLLAALGGFALGAYYLLQYFAGNIAVPGYASTITAIFVLGGLQLLSLGIIGEYLGRLHLNVNRKPQYTIRTVARPEEVPGETAGGNRRAE